MSALFWWLAFQNKALLSVGLSWRHQLGRTKTRVGASKYGARYPAMFDTGRTSGFSSMPRSLVMKALRARMRAQVPGNLSRNSSRPAGSNRTMPSSIFDVP